MVREGGQDKFGVPHDGLKFFDSGVAKHFPYNSSNSSTETIVLDRFLVIKL